MVAAVGRLSLAYIFVVAISSPPWDSPRVSNQRDSKIRVLIVDDHTVVREGLRRILAEEPDIEVTGEAATGEEAVEKVRRDAFDLVLLDISMPGRGGMDALKNIRRTRPALPVLMLSMHADDQYAMRCFRAGASGYIMKERPPAELLDAIRTAADGRRYLSGGLAAKLADLIADGALPRPHEKLSDREDQVLRRIVAGHSLKAIGEEMDLSVKTVSTYKRRIIEKLHVGNTANLIRYALDNHIN